MIDNISEIGGGKTDNELIDEDEEDDLDEMAKFIEGHDNELTKDHSDIF